MDYSINPEKHELEAVKREIEGVVQKYKYSLEAENIEFNMGWQRLEKDCNVISSTENTLTVIIDPEKELENLEISILRGLLEIEFLDKADYDQLRYNWQEIARMAYVKARVSQLTDRELEMTGLEGDWSKLKESLSDRTGEYSEELYLDASTIAEAVAEYYTERNRTERLPDAKRTDIIKAGDDSFN